LSGIVQREKMLCRGGAARNHHAFLDIAMGGDKLLFKRGAALNVFGSILLQNPES